MTIYLSIYQSILFFLLSIYLSHFCDYLSICLSINLSISFCEYLSIDLIFVTMLCFDFLTRPKMPFKVVHRKEVTHPSRWKSEEVAQALRRVYITAWEFEGNIRPTN